MSITLTDSQVALLRAFGDGGTGRLPHKTIVQVGGLTFPSHDLHPLRAARLIATEVEIGTAHGPSYSITEAGVRYLSTLDPPSAEDRVLALLAVIRTERERQGLSKMSLGVRAGLTKSTVANLDSKENADLYVSSLVRLADVLGLDVVLVKKPN